MWGYHGSPWMTLNKELQDQMSACLQRTYISVIQITYEEIQPSSHENQPVQKRKIIFKEMPRAAILFLKKEANFSRIEAYLNEDILQIWCR